MQSLCVGAVGRRRRIDSSREGAPLLKGPGALMPVLCRVPSQAEPAAGGRVGSHRSLSVESPWAACARTGGKEFRKEKGSGTECLPVSGSEAPVLSPRQEARQTPQPKRSIAASGVSGAGGVLISGLCLMWVLRRGVHWIWGCHWSNGLLCPLVMRLVGKLWITGEANFWNALDWMGGEVSFCCWHSSVSVSASPDSLGDSFS